MKIFLKILPYASVINNEMDSENIDPAAAGIRVGCVSIISRCLFVKWKTVTVGRSNNSRTWLSWVSTSCRDASLICIQL